jgi:hypothetical protein
MTLARLILIAALGCLGATSQAGDLRGVRVESLRGDLQSLRWRVERAPRASLFDLKRLQRRLAEQRAEAPGDPRLARLELQRRHAQWQAERALARAKLGRAPRGGLGLPDQLRGPTDLDLRGAALPIGTGKRYLLIQSGLRDARAALERGRNAAAAGHLARAEGGLRALRTLAGADDPNLVALAAELGELKARVAAAGDAG